MRFLFQISVIAILAFFLQYLLPWWGVAVSSFVGGLIISSRANFSAGFLGIGILWLLGALWTDSVSEVSLAERVAEIFTVTKPVLMAVTAVIGGLIGGFSALSGSLLNRRRKDSNPYRF